MRFRYIICSFVLWFSYTQIFGNITLPVNENLGLESFVKDLFKKFEPGETLFVIYGDKCLDILVKYVHVKTIINTKLNTNYIPITKFRTYLLVIQTLDDYKKILVMLSKRLNYQGKYVIFYLQGINELKNLFELSWNNSLLNVNVVLESDSNFEMYTYFPFANGSCGNSRKPVRLDVNSGVRFPEKVELDMMGCPIRLTGGVLEPYVIDVTEDWEDPTRSGLEVTIIYNILKRMNATTVIIKNDYPYWGTMDADGHFTYSLDDLHKRKVDIIFGMILGNHTLYNQFDTSAYITDVVIVWVVPSAGQMPQWKNISVIFQAIVWFIILLSFTTNGLFWWLVGRKKDELPEYKDLTLCLMGSYYMLLQGSFSTPKTRILKFSVIVWSVASVLLFTAHQCELTGILTSPMYDHQITTIEEILDSNLEFGFNPVVLSMYDDSNPTEKKVKERGTVCDISSTCMNRTAFQRDFATVRNKKSVLYYVPQYYTLPSGRPMVYYFRDNLLLSHCTYYVNHGFPFLQRINRLLLLLNANGLVSKWESDLMPRQKVQTLDLEALSLNHLQAAFYLLALGLLISTFVFLGEKWKNHWKLRQPIN